MNIFKGQNLLEFAERFMTDEDCKKYLSEIKCALGYTCRKCGHHKYQERKDFDITQILSKNGLNFKALHTMIHQVKSWIRTTYSWVSEKNINRYFDEFSYRINRSQSKETIFNNLIMRMVRAEHITYHQILCS